MSDNQISCPLCDQKSGHKKNCGVMKPQMVTCTNCDWSGNEVQLIEYKTKNVLDSCPDCGCIELE